MAQWFKFFSKHMRGTPFDQPWDICWQGVGICLDEQMDMIRLDGEALNVPVVLLYHFLNKVFESISNLPH